jgi:signal transduction histidine kinase
MPARQLSGEVPRDVLAGLAALSRVSRALVGTGELAALAARALDEMCAALDLETAALYLPDADGQPVLRRYVADRAVRAELAFDEEAWRLTVASGAPIVLREPATWLVENPFDPPAEHWLILPLVSEQSMVGVVIASAREPIAIDPLSGTVLSLLGIQLSAGVTTARLRQKVREAEMERERRKLAAEVHDGLAQYLAVAQREVALLDSGSGYSPERLRASISEAHRLVRARLQELLAPAPLGGLRDAIEQSAERVRRRGLTVRVSGDGDGLEPEAVSLVTRVVSEALANVDAHARAREVAVDFSIDDERLELDVTDDGCGFDPATAPGVDEGHLGLTVMRERARAYGGDCTVESALGAGTRVRLRIPA